MLTKGGAASRAVGFALLGVATGIAIGLVESALKDRWLYVTAGPLAGKQFILYKARTLIGSDQKCDIYLFKDPNVLAEHAIVEIAGSRVQFRALGPAYVSGQPARVQALQSGNSVQIGRYAFAIRKGSVSESGLPLLPHGNRVGRRGTARMSRCGTPHHPECFAENGGCTVFGCSKAPQDDPKISVSGTELNQARTPFPAPIAPAPVARTTHSGGFSILQLSGPSQPLGAQNAPASGAMPPPLPPPASGTGAPPPPAPSPEACTHRCSCFLSLQGHDPRAARSTCYLGFSLEFSECTISTLGIYRGQFPSSVLPC